jgi:hypothetical protein
MNEALGKGLESVEIEGGWMQQRMKMEGWMREMPHEIGEGPGLEGTRCI